MVNDFLVEKNKINISVNTTLDVILKLYREKIDSMADSNFLRKYFTWDYELFICSENTMHIKYGKKNRLAPYLIYTNNAQYPDLENFEKDRIEFYDMCLNASDNVAMNLRYLDYLVDYGYNNYKYNYAKKLVEITLNNCNIENYKDNTELLDYISKISRAVDISVSFKMNDKIIEVEKEIVGKISKLIDIREYRWTLEMAELLRYMCYNKKEKRISQESINIVISCLEICKNYYKNEKNIHLHQAFCWEVLEWIKNENSSDKNINNILYEIGKSYEDESEYQGGREKKSFLVKTHFLECAVNHYINIGARDKVFNLKVKIKEAYRLGRTEVEEHKSNMDIPNYDLIVKEADKFILDTIEKSFNLFSRARFFTPELDNIIMTAKKRQDNSLINLVGITKIAGDRKVFDANGDDERRKYFIYEEYNIMLQLMFSIIYDNAWIKLIEQGLTCEMVVSRIIEWEYMDDRDVEIIKRGIERYFADDFISAIHILTPKFENCFRDFFSWGGYATTSIKNSTIQHEQNFNDFILNDFVKQNIDEDTLFLIQYVMTDNLGYNLRNDVAHGLAGVDRFNRNTANMVIYLFFVLTNLNWEISEDR